MERGDNAHKDRVAYAEDTLSFVDVRFIANNKYPDNTTIDVRGHSQGRHAHTAELKRQHKQ